MYATRCHLLLLVAHCCRGGRKTLPVPNPHLAASSIRGCARKTGRKTMVTDAKRMVAVSTGGLPAPVTLLVPSIFFTCCHLTLSTCGGRKRPLLQPWHHAAVAKWDVSVASSGKRTDRFCINKKPFAIVQSLRGIRKQRNELPLNVITALATLVGN